MQAILREDLSKKYKAGMMVDVLVLDRVAKWAKIRRPYGRKSRIVDLKILTLVDGRWHKLSGKTKR